MSSSEKESYRLDRLRAALTCARRFLFENYKAEHWYWEPVEMTRRIFMTGFLVVLARGSYEQILVCLLVTFASLKALSSRSPFAAPMNNAVAEAMLWQTIVTLLLCVLLRSKELEGRAKLTRVDIVMTVAQVGWVPVLVYNWLKRKRREKEGMVAIMPVGGGADGMIEDGNDVLTLMRENQDLKEQLEAKTKADRRRKEYDIAIELAQGGERKEVKFGEKGREEREKGRAGNSKLGEGWEEWRGKK